MTEPTSHRNLEIPITAGILDVSGIHAPDGGSEPNSEEQNLSDADLADIRRC